MSRAGKPLKPMTDAQRQLVEDNLKLVQYVIYKYFPAYRDDDEMISAATYALCLAAINWDESKCKFSTYACISIRNTIRTEFRERAKRLPTISLYTPLGEDRMTLEDVIPSDDASDYVVNYSFLNTLTDDERLVYELRQKGHSVEEIEEITGYNHRKVLRIMRLGRAKYYKYNR